jgi:NADH-quinone oxidoreductase subunit I
MTPQPMTPGVQKPIIHRRDLSFWNRLYLPQIVAGMRITLAQIFRPKFTRQYPEERWNPPASFRGRPVLVEEKGVERCVACGLCARVCPALAIEVQGSETELWKERYPVRFEINMLRCIFCGFCEEVCPEEAIVMSQDFELTFASQEEAIYAKDRLLVPAEELKERLAFLRENR